MRIKEQGKAPEGGGRGVRESTTLAVGTSGHVKLVHTKPEREVGEIMEDPHRAVQFQEVF